MRRALLLVPLILACGGLGTTETRDAGLPSDEAPPPPAVARLSLDKSIVNFGTLEVGTTGVGTVTLTNTGNAVSGAVTITASEGVTATGCSAPLPAGASCAITITGTQPVGTFAGRVSISADPGAVPPLMVFVISSVSLLPPFVVSPGMIDLGRVPRGFPVSPIEITVYTGTGVTDLTLAASGPDVSIDQDDTTCTEVLAPGASCVVVVDFLAATVGSKSDALVISGGFPAGKVVTVSITANVVFASFLLIAPSTPQGASALVGTASSPITFLVGNQGDTPTGTLSVAVTGPDAADFFATSTCTVLAPLANCAVSVVYQPGIDSAGSGAATLTVTDTSSLTSTVVVSLSGIVAPGQPWLAITSTTSDLGQVPVGRTGTPVVFTVTKNDSDSPTGVLTATVSSPELVLGDDTCTGRSLAKSESCTLAIALRPMTAGAKTATLTVTGTTGGPAIRYVTGTGVVF